MNKDEMDVLYQEAEYVWGTDPSRLARELLQHVGTGSKEPQTLLELGAGEGRDSVYFAEQGFRVTGIDLSEAGLRKAECLAGQRGVGIQCVLADINTYELTSPVDILYSIGALQYVRPELRQERFEHWKQNTSPGGIHCLFAFIVRPDAPLSPDWGSEEYPYSSEELLGLYLDWEILHSYEYRFPCDSGGVPHVHAARVLIAGKSSRDQY